MRQRVLYALLLTFAPVAWLAFVYVPVWFPFAESWDYAYDVGAYYLVDVPYHAHVPRPYLRLYFVCYLYATLATLTLILEGLATHTCHRNAVGTTFVKADGLPRIYVRTVVYASEQDARGQRNPISGPSITEVLVPSLEADQKKKKK